MKRIVLDFILLMAFSVFRWVNQVLSLVGNYTKSVPWGQMKVPERGIGGEGEVKVNVPLNKIDTAVLFTLKEVQKGEKQKMEKSNHPRRKS
jgi:hypothetical protein